MTLVLEENGQRHFRTLEKNLPQASLLTGLRGIGLKTIATALAGGDLAAIIEPELLTKTSSIPQISTETIRKLYEETRGKSTARQVVLIDDADKMTPSAQHAFLKLLEEPKESIRFILTSHHPEKLLPTVRSRVQSYYFEPADARASADFIANLAVKDDAKQAQMMFIAPGLPAELTRLARDEGYFEELAGTVRMARDILAAGGYDRLRQIVSLGLGRLQTLMLIEVMLRLLMRQPNPQSAEVVDHLLKAHRAIEGGGNSRLHLAAAMV